MHSRQRRSLPHRISDFKNVLPAQQSVVTLAGTGPNVAQHVSVLRHLGLDYLKNLNRLNSISGSVFSIMIYLAHRQGGLDLEALHDYEARVTRLHGMSWPRAIGHLVGGRPKRRNLYSNHLIGETVKLFFSESFYQTRLADVDLPLSFFVYCQRRETVLELNRTTFPDITFIDLCRASIGIPGMHGAYHYGDFELTDPIFSPEFKALRRRLFRSSNNHLYVNHKKNDVSGRIHFLVPDERRFSQLALLTDFLKLYFGIHNSSNLATCRNAIEGLKEHGH